jgi:hypothetical protein
MTALIILAPLSAQMLLLMRAAGKTARPMACAPFNSTPTALATQADLRHKDASDVPLFSHSCGNAAAKKTTAPTQ